MKKALLAILLVTLTAVYADAALVTLTSTKTGLTTFQIKATVSEADAFGLASYTIALGAGTFTTITNSGGNIAGTFQDVGGGINPNLGYGFTLLASGPNGNPVTGSQDTIGVGQGTKWAIYGIGELPGPVSVASNMPSGYDTVVGTTSIASPVLLIAGKTASGAAAPTILINGMAMVAGQRYTSSTDTGFGVFSTDGPQAVEPVGDFISGWAAPTIASDVMFIPEPATIGLLILGLGLLRRKH